MHAPLPVIWEQLIYKIYHPEKYIKGVSDVKILEDDSANHRVIRQMKVTTPTISYVVLEEITWDESKLLMDFKSIEHPTHTGNVINRVDIKNDNEYWLTYEMRWAFKGEGADPLDPIIIKML